MGVRKVCFCFVLFLTVCAVEAQIDHKEQLHVLTSSNDLLSGQSLHFQAQVSSLETGRKSQLSSLLYVELLNDANEALWQAKVLLDEGYGGGSYYIPSITPTGTYHLVAYTRWMKNFGEFYSHFPILPTVPYAYDSIRIAGIVTRSINSQIENAFYLPQPRKASGVEPWFEGFKSYLLGRDNIYSVFFRVEEEPVEGFKLTVFRDPIPEVTYNFHF